MKLFVNFIYDGTNLSYYLLAFHANAKQTSRSLSVVNPNNAGRKALKEGLEMLEARYLFKDS